MNHNTELSAPKKRNKNVSRQVSKIEKSYGYEQSVRMCFFRLQQYLCWYSVRELCTVTVKNYKSFKSSKSLQKELADLKEQNKTKYNSVMDSVNLDEIREKAMNELGMVYATSDQVIEYEIPSGDYVKQYEEFRMMEYLPSLIRMRNR